MPSNHRLKGAALAVLLTASGGACASSPAAEDFPLQDREFTFELAPSSPGFSIQPCVELKAEYIDFLVAAFGADYSAGTWSVDGVVLAYADTEDGPAFACGEELS